MAQVIVRNVDQRAVESLRRRASATARSLEAELRLMIEREARWDSEAEAFWRDSDAFRDTVSEDIQTDSAILRSIGRRGEVDLLSFQHDISVFEGG